MQCPNCGHENTQTSRFCARCGFDVNAPAEPAAASPDPWGLPSGTPPPPQPIEPSPAAPAPAPAPTWGQPPPSGAAPPPGSAPPTGGAPLPPYEPPPANPNPYAPPAPYVPPPPGQYVPPGPGAYPPPGYPQQGGYPPPGYPQQGGYPPAYPGPGYYGPSTNGMAIAALILGLVGWLFCGIGSVLAVVFGFVSQGQITSSQGRQSGAGMAKAGIILGFIGIALNILYWVAVIATTETT